MKDKLNEKLLSRLIGLARATEGNEELMTEETKRLLYEGIGCLFCEEQKIQSEWDVFYRELLKEKKRIVPNCFDCASPCGRTADYDMQEFWKCEEENQQLKLEILKLLEQQTEVDIALYALIVLGWNGSRESLQRARNKLQ